MDFGLLIVWKPSGPTSHDVVEAVRRATRVQRIGHTGTLDPLAEGVLVLCAGKATRLVEYLTAHDKSYRATVRLGVETDTLDADGKVIRESPVAATRPKVEAALARFRGAIRQRPPAYSARRVEGERAFERARRGETVELPEQEVRVDSLELVEFAPPDLVIDLDCSAGTYVRSLARDLGTALGCGAHLRALARTRCGAFSRADAVDLAELQHAADWRSYLVPVERALAHWPAVHLTPAEADAVRAGRPVPFRDGARPAPGAGMLWRAHAPDGSFLAVLAPDFECDRLQPRKVLG